MVLTRGNYTKLPQQELPPGGFPRILAGLQAGVGHCELAQSDSGSAGRKPIRSTEAEMQDVVAFLKTLSGPVVERASR
jgi:hypothetical protein